MHDLSILICSIPERAALLKRLLDILWPQCYETQGVEILINKENGTIGKKRNCLLENAAGRYITYIDDDDIVSTTYIREVLEQLKDDPDCLSLTGVITWNGINPEVFEHSIKYKAYRTNESGAVKYERYPNHLNVIKASIAKRFKFPEINHGEDTDWATQLHKSGLLKKENELKGVHYHYQYITNK